MVFKVTSFCEILDKLVPVSLEDNKTHKTNHAKQKKVKSIKSYNDLITFVADRPGHDLRYAIDESKIKKDFFVQTLSKVLINNETNIDYTMAHSLKLGFEKGTRPRWKCYSY